MQTKWFDCTHEIKFKMFRILQLKQHLSHVSTGALFEEYTIIKLIFQK